MFTRYKNHDKSKMLSPDLVYILFQLFSCFVLIEGLPPDTGRSRGRTAARPLVSFGVGGKLPFSLCSAFCLAAVLWVG